jgi:hypothetical protein
LQYESGDWDTDQRMPANLLNSLIEYTTLAVDTNEKVIPLSSDELFKSPFCYISGHKLVQFTKKEKENFEKYVKAGGFVFADDCNHDIDGLFAKSFEKQKMVQNRQYALRRKHCYTCNDCIRIK